MTYPISVPITMFRDRIPVKLIVKGIWQNDHIEAVSVKHGAEILPMKWYYELIEEAKKQAEYKIKRSLIDQEEKRDANIQRLCGF
jgi:hypothetical protein